MNSEIYQILPETRNIRAWKHAAKLAFVVCTIFLLVHCGGTRDRNTGYLSLPADYVGHGYYETPSGKYAAEILSYMMQVVVGTAGDPANRQAWQTTSRTAALDLNEVGNIMQDPERNISELMVYDANILGLSKVLYHYNPRLNYFKGRALQESVYPSEELLAIRLFMVQKIARGEKVRMGNLMRRPTLLDDPLADPSPAALAMINLSIEELRLLRDVVQAEPFFKGYLEDPFLVESLHRVGIVEMDGYVRDKIEAADYSGMAKEYSREAAQGKVVRVAILPSMIKSFDFQAREAQGFPLGFRANEDYLAAADTLKRKLRTELRRRIAEVLEKDGGADISREAAERHAAEFVNAHLQFIDFDKRPLVVYPENAEKVIQSLCPDADFNFVILGKNVYLSMAIDENKDVFPFVNRVYLDIMDISQSQSDYEIEQAGGYLFERLKMLVPDL